MPSSIKGGLLGLCSQRILDDPMDLCEVHEAMDFLGSRTDARCQNVTGNWDALRKFEGRWLGEDPGSCLGG